MGDGFNYSTISELLTKIRGKPDLIISDNAPQFKLTNTVLSEQCRKFFVDKDVLSYVAVEGIKWNFTTALAPW